MTFSPDKMKSSLRLIVNAEHILITTHISPDGDAIGSTLALQHFLKKMGKHAVIITPNNFPDFLRWMPGAESILVYEGNEPKAEEIVRRSDLIFTLDLNDLKRLDRLENAVGYSDAPKIMIDHHEQPKDYPLITFSDTSASSTCQLVYDFIEAAGFLHVMDEVIAACIYSGIFTDTGGFRFSGTSAHTHHIVSRLMETGLDHVSIVEKINDAFTYDRLRLLGYILDRKLVHLPHYHCIYMSLTEKEMQQFNYQPGDTEGIVNYGLSVHGIKLSVLFKEKDGKVKISFRSKGSFSVQQLAREHFYGGGHMNASGGTSFDSMEATIDRFRAILPNYLAQLEEA